jgi:hypothetical protein
LIHKSIESAPFDSNIVRGNLAQAAVLHDKIPRQLSFRSSVQLVCQAAKQIDWLIGEPLTCAVLALTQAIAATAIGLQKRKKQPRAIKRRPKPFPLLMTPRHEAFLSLWI